MKPLFRAKNHRGKGRKRCTKALVIIAAEENGKGIGRIRMAQIPDRSRRSLHDFIGRTIEPGSNIHTDGCIAYNGLVTLGYQITNDPQMGEIVIIGPVSHVPITDFPAVIRLALNAHVTGGHGTYHLAFELRASDGDTVWQWQPVDALHHADPLTPMQITFDELRVSVQEPGRYDLVLLAGGDEIASQPLLIGPVEVFRGDGA